jgi:regulator of sirC expression with transglutaminase-like and TPR domain
LEENKEITALLHLIDDPDEDVYNAVSNKIVSFGKEIIPALEHFWENVTDNETQERIEMLIHRLHFSDLTADFVKWKNDNTDILSGALLVAKYTYPDMDVSVILKEIEKLRRNIWLEMNSYLTPLEQINVINSIFYNYYKQRGTEISYENPDGFLLNKVLESRKGNAFGNGVAYLVLCSLLDVPVRAIGIPKQFILGYFDIQHDVMNPSGHSSEKIKFYIDPVNGQMYSHKDVENYFKKLSVPPVSSYFRPLTNKVIVQYLLEELGKCYDNNAQQYKVDELRTLINLLDE